MSILGKAKAKEKLNNNIKYQVQLWEDNKTTDLEFVRYMVEAVEIYMADRTGKWSWYSNRLTDK